MPSKECCSPGKIATTSGMLLWMALLLLGSEANTLENQWRVVQTPISAYCCMTADGRCFGKGLGDCRKREKCYKRIHEMIHPQGIDERRYALMVALHSSNHPGLQCYSCM